MSKFRIVEYKEINDDENLIFIKNNVSFFDNFKSISKIKYIIKIIFFKYIQKINSINVLKFITFFFVIIYVRILTVKLSNKILNQNELLLKNYSNSNLKRLNNIIEELKNSFREKFISDNKIENFVYEENIDFSNYSSDIKAIAIYVPTFYNINNKNKIISDVGWNSIRNAKPLYKEHNQPRKPISEDKYLGYYDLSDVKVIKKQVQLAKSHGIYGFGIYYYWYFGAIFYEKPLKLFFESKEINFPFFLIWKNNLYSLAHNNKKNRLNIIKAKKKKKNKDFIKDIEKYLKDSKYIKINLKPVIGIYDSLLIENIEKVIKTWRKYCKKKKIGEILIITNLKNNSPEKYKDMNIFDASFEFPPENIDPQYLMKNDYYFYYTGLIYNSFN